MRGPQALTETGAQIRPTVPLYTAGTGPVDWDEVRAKTRRFTPEKSVSTSDESIPKYVLQSSLGSQPLLVTAQTSRRSDRPYAFQRSSTEPQHLRYSLVTQLKTLFEDGKECLFEDGMESQFSRELNYFVWRHGETAVDLMADLIVNDKIDAEVASEALRWLGRVDHAPTCQTRLWLLEKALFSSSPKIRDGAGLGIASMDDPHAITYIKQAIEKEGVQDLRQDLEQVLEQLEMR